MSKVLITGNGFDLFHFLPTSYNNFMFILGKVEELDLNNREEDLSYKELFGDGWTDIEENYDIERIFFNLEKIKKLQSLLKENTWYQYFKYINGLNTWIAFELEIKKALDTVLEFFQQVKEWINAFDFDNYIALPQYKHLQGVKASFNNIDNYNRFKLLNFIELDRHSDIKIKLKYLKIFEDQIIDLNEQKILEDLAESLEGFKIIFNCYFADIVQPFYPALSKNDDSLLSHLTELNLFSNVEYFFTFNYTPTIEKLYNQSDVEYLHGKIDDNNNTLQNIVLGVDDIRTELKQYKAYDFTKYFQKLNQDTQYKFLNTLEREIFESGNVFTFYILGFSLDESDQGYIKELFNCLKNTNNKLVVFYYRNKITDKTSKSGLLKNLLFIMGEKIINKAMIDGQLDFLELTKENLEYNFK